jgi:rhodanese-related sulfurtransferase
MQKIGAEALKGILERGAATVLIVDVREISEVSKAPLLPSVSKQYVNIPLGILRMLPKEELRLRLEETAQTAGIKLEEARIILSCRSGGRSRQAQGILAEAGIIAENLEGGYAAWQQQVKTNETAR